MILASDEDRLWSPPDSLARIHRDNRDGILVVLYIFRREMRSKPEDLPGIPVIPVEIKGLSG